MWTWARLLLLPLVAACGQPSDPKADVVHQYAVLIHANLQDAVTHVQALQAAVDRFVEAPAADSHAAAKQAWLDCRPSYGQVEVGRFYRGPIDELQGSINEWPIDENFIDYTEGNPDHGIINRTQDVPEITPQVLDYYDGRAGAGNLALGFHALEFLLWGQRPDLTQGPGQRPFTDYVDGGTAMNQARRRTYLKVATELLVRDLTEVRDDWDINDPMSFGSQMLARPPEDALTDILRGQGGMAISELLYERLSDPYVTRDRKDEESCFSESTHIDLAANALGVENVYLGRYHDVSGPSVADLIAAMSPDLDARMRQQLQGMRAAIEALPEPFDHAVIAPDGSEPRLKVKAAIDSFSALPATMVEVAQALGITINL